VEIAVEHASGYTRLAGTGRLNMVRAPRLREAVAVVIASGHHHLVLDMAGVEFVDSSGLGALVGCLKAARQAGGDLRIANVSPQVRMVLELTGMTRVFTPYDSVDEAFPRG
jgi:anti-sigma B factor antagonist